MKFWLEDYFAPAVFEDELVIVAGAIATDSATFLLAGGRQIDMTRFPESAVDLTRKVKLVADVRKTAGATNVSVKLVDLTHGGVLVTGTNLTYSASNDLAELVSAELGVGSSAGQIRSDAPALYELQVKMTGGVVGVDEVTVANARLRISYE